MARIEGLTERAASFTIRVLFWIGQRKLGRVSEMWRVAAHVPRLHFGRGSSNCRSTALAILPTVCGVSLR